MRHQACMRLVRVLACTLILAPMGAFAAEVHSYAMVQDDGTLRVRGKVYRLAGIYIPETNYQCRKFERPVRCAPRAALALDFKIQGFVTCRERGRNGDGSFDAVCHVDKNAFSNGEDLAAYMLRSGWAVALPSAPFEYHAMEKIARHNERGVWGFQVDSVVTRDALNARLPPGR